MPSLAEMFPNLAKLSKDDGSVSKHGGSASKPRKRAKPPKAPKQRRPPRPRRQRSERRSPRAARRAAGKDFSLTMGGGSPSANEGGTGRESKLPSVAKLPSVSRLPSVGRLPSMGRLPSAPSLGSLRELSFGRGARAGASLVGLDIQPGYVTAVEAEVNGIVAVKRAVGLPLPADTMREGEVIDEALLAEVLKELFAKGHLNKRVRIGLANQRTVVRTMELPPIEDRKELAAAVNFAAQDQIPMPLTSAMLDFQPIGIVQTPAGRRQRVVVVAAQREMVQRLVGAVRAAGLRPAAVDLSAFAMIRALHRPEEPATETLRGDDARLREEREEVAATTAAHAAPPGPDDDASQAAGAGVGEAPAEGSNGVRTLYLNVGGLTNLAIADGVTCRFTRAVGGGLESMAGALAERRSVPLAEARAAIAEFDLAKREQQSEQRSGPTANDPAAMAAEVRTVIAGGLREIAGEVRNSLDFHRAQESGGSVDRVVVSGAALEINGFTGALEAELGFPVQRRTVARARDGELDGVPAERLTVAAGLAVEEVAP